MGVGDRKVERRRRRKRSERTAKGNDTQKETGERTANKRGENQRQNGKVKPRQ